MGRGGRILEASRLYNHRSLALCLTSYGDCLDRPSPSIVANDDCVGASGLLALLWHEAPILNRIHSDTRARGVDRHGTETLGTHKGQGTKTEQWSWVANLHSSS
ncbi:unnamed protein product [Lampetra fluviatilis]